MKITQGLVKDVKRSDRKVWHDKEWHAFQAKKEVEAIHYAMMTETELSQIVSAAKEYIASK
jgi:hypothetical protein